MFSDNQHIQFEIFGFTVLPNLLTSDELTTINAEFNVGLAKAREMTNRRGIRKQLNWSNLGPNTPFLSSLLEDLRFLKFVEKIYGRDFIGYYANANSFDGDRTEWHPDTGNLRWRGLKFAFYLQSLDENTGALRFIPASHTDPLHSDIKKISLKETNSGIIDEQGLDICNMPAYVAKSQPGDVVVFDNRTWHASWGGGRGRRMCSLGYFAAPTTSEEEALIPEMGEQMASLIGSFPLLKPHPDWASNLSVSPVRQHWIRSLKEWGFPGFN